MLLLWLLSFAVSLSFLLPLRLQKTRVVSQLIESSFPLLFVQLILSLVLLLVNTVIYLETSIFLLLQHTPIPLFQVLLVKFRLFVAFSVSCATFLTVLSLATCFFLSTPLPFRIRSTRWWRTARRTGTRWTSTLLSLLVFLLFFLFSVLLFFLLLLFMFLALLVLFTFGLWLHREVILLNFLNDLLHLNGIVYDCVSSFLLLPHDLKHRVFV